MNKERFIWLLKNSVRITNIAYPGSIFYYMDKNIERQLKLHKVLDINNPIKIDLNIINPKNIFFEKSNKNKHLWVSYDNIWEKIESNNESKDHSIYTLCSMWLNSDSKFRQYTIGQSITHYDIFLIKTKWDEHTGD